MLLLNPGDHVEAGSTLRSAAAFGWDTVAIDDRDKVWFGTPRPVRTEARAAARSHRNPLRVVPMQADAYDFTRVVVAGTTVPGPPIHRVRLATRPRSLLVIPDESAIDRPMGWHWRGGSVEFARVELPERNFPYRYRLVASIVLAEVARQLGAGPVRRPVRGPARTPRRARYRSAISYAPADVDLVHPGELLGY